MTCLSPANCKDVRDALRKYPWRREARRFWEAHEQAVLDLAEDELRALTRALRNKDKPAALLVLLLAADKDTWLGERAATLSYLEAVKDRRVAMAEAMAKLGAWALRLLGRVLMRVVGL